MTSETEIVANLRSAKVAKKHAQLLLDAATVIEEQGTVHKATVADLRTALTECENMKNALRDTMVSKMAYDNLKERLNATQTECYTTAHILTICTVSFVIGVGVAIALFR